MSTEAPKLSEGFRAALERLKERQESDGPGITYDSFEDYLDDMHQHAAEHDREKAGGLVEYAATPEQLAAAKEIEAKSVAAGLVPGRDFQTFGDYLKEMNRRAAELERQASSGKSS